jgi:hypothetical protein
LISGTGKSKSERNVKKTLQPDTESSTVEIEQPPIVKSAVKVGLKKKIKEKERNSIATSCRSPSARSVTESKQNRRSSLSSTKSTAKSERSIAESKQRRPSLISGTGKSKSERHLKKNNPQDTKALERCNGSGRSSSPKSENKSVSKLPLETKEPSKRHESGRSKSVQRNSGSSKSDGKKTDSKLPSETKEGERRGRGRSKSSQRRSGSKFREKAESKLLPPLTNTPKQRGRGSSVPRFGSSSDKNDDSKLPPETKTIKKQARRRSLSTQRGVNIEVHTLEIPHDEPHETPAVARRKERRQEGNVPGVSEMKASIEAVSQSESGVLMNWDAGEQGEEDWFSPHVPVPAPKDTEPFHRTQLKRGSQKNEVHTSNREQQVKTYEYNIPSETMWAHIRKGNFKKPISDTNATMHNADAFSDARNDTIDESFVSPASYLDEEAHKAAAARFVAEKRVSPMKEAKRAQPPSAPVRCKSEDLENDFAWALEDDNSDAEESSEDHLNAEALVTTRIESRRTQSPSPPVRCRSKDLMDDFAWALEDDNSDAEESS